MTAPVTAPQPIPRFEPVYGPMNNREVMSPQGRTLGTLSQNPTVNLSPFLLLRNYSFLQGQPYVEKKENTELSESSGCWLRSDVEFG